MYDGSVAAKQWLSHGNDVILYLDIEDIYVQVALLIDVLPLCTKYMHIIE